MIGSKTMTYAGSLHILVLLHTLIVQKDTIIQSSYSLKYLYPFPSSKSINLLAIDTLKDFSPTTLHLTPPFWYPYSI